MADKANEIIDFSRYLGSARAQSEGRAANERESKRAHPERETRPQSEKERFADSFQRRREYEGRSNWSGGGMGGGTWGGRSRGGGQ